MGSSFGIIHDVDSSEEMLDVDTVDNELVRFFEDRLNAAMQVIVKPSIKELNIFFLINRGAQQKVRNQMSHPRLMTMRRHFL